MFELSKQFRFDAAHTLPGRAVDADGSRRVHGHSYRAEVVVRGEIDSATGMVVDLGLLERKLAALRDALDHRFLDEVEGLGPPTMERLCLFIWRALNKDLANLARVSVHRDSSGEACVYCGEGAS